MINRRSHSKLIFAALLVALAMLPGCKRSGRTGLSLPRYPGADYHPQSRRERETHDVLRADLHTPDAFATVLKFYVDELSQLPGWSGPTQGKDFVVWADENMDRTQLHLGDPIDPSKHGGLITITNTPDRTVIGLYESIPKPTAAE